MAVLILFASFIFPVGAALAHTEVTGTSPSSGEVLVAPPRAVLVTLSSPPVALESATVTVGGEDITGFARLDPEDARRLVIPIDGSGPGVYVAKWDVVAADGHRIPGTTSFTVTGTSLMSQISELATLLSEVGAGLRESGVGS